MTSLIVSLMTIGPKLAWPNNGVIGCARRVPVIATQKAKIMTERGRGAVFTVDSDLEIEGLGAYPEPRYFGVQDGAHYLHWRQHLANYQP